MEPKPESRIERKKAETQNRIINAAIGLFHQRGLQAVTMEQIAETADIAKGTLYNYYPSKEAIIDGFIQRTIQQRNDERVALLRTLPDTRSRLTQVLKLLIEAVQAQKEIFEAFMIHRMKQVISFHPVPGEQAGLGELARTIIELGQQAGELRTDLPEDLLGGLFDFVLFEAIKPLYLEPEVFDPDESIARCVDLFINGAGA